ncbi:hypothetical protein V8C86DRAFT_2465553 [Haematococcus lacustris]
MTSSVEDKQALLPKHNDMKGTVLEEKQQQEGKGEVYEAQRQQKEQQQQQQQGRVLEVPLLSSAPLELAPTAVHNEFAERMAQQALARLATGAIWGNLHPATATPPASSSSSTSMPLSTAGTALTLASGFTSQPAQPSSSESVVAPPPPAHMPFRPSAMLAAAALAAAQQPAARSTTPVASSDALHVAELALGAGAIENGAEEGGAARPRLKLLPRSLPLEPHVPGPLDRAGSTESLPAATGSTAVTHPAGPATQTLTTRPRLQLQPRSQRPGSAESDAPGAGPVAQGGSTAAAPKAGTGVKTSAIFGSARPREQILKERGVDPVALDAGETLSSVARRATASHPLPPYLPASSKPHTAQGSFAAIGDERSTCEQWMTVGKQGRTHGRWGALELKCCPQLDRLA